MAIISKSDKEEKQELTNNKGFTLPAVVRVDRESMTMNQAFALSVGLHAGLTAAAVLGCFTGCAGDKANSGAGNSTNTGTSKEVEKTQKELSGKISLAGSTSMEKLCEAMSESFMEAYPNVTVTVEYTGSSAGVEALVQSEILAERIREVVLPHRMAELGEAVRNQAIALGKQRRAKLRRLPAGQISVDPVEERGVVVERLREGLEQVRRSHHVCDAPEGVALKGDGGIGADGVSASGKTAVGHVVLHDLNHVTGGLSDACYLVKGDAVPIADQTNSARCHVIEHI
jgi:hypothetical protein